MTSIDQVAIDTTVAEIAGLNPIIIVKYLQFAIKERFGKHNF